MQQNENILFFKNGIRLDVFFSHNYLNYYTSILRIMISILILISLKHCVV